MTPLPTRRTAAAALALVLVAALAAAPGAAVAGKPDGVGKPKPTPTPPPPSEVAFAGYTWTVKATTTKVGPGPNLFSASNVSVEADGLHLRIAKSGGNRWTTAEVINQASLGYGTYEWTVASQLDGLDQNVVLGLFTWNDDPAYAHREIDIEFARWSNPNDPTNAQYVVQPWDVAGHEYRFTQPSGGGTVHRFTWAPGEVTFESRTSGGALITAWTFAGPDVPVPGGENARINLWLFRGVPPSDRTPVEVVLSDFRFTPPG
jgi:hypothetical protein